jgi:hypothetical protein
MGSLCGRMGRRWVREGLQQYPKAVVLDATRDTQVVWLARWERTTACRCEVCTMLMERAKKYQSIRGMFLD